MPDTQLILHVKGTEQETTTLPRQVVRAAISQGQITHSQLIWSPPDNAWKQVRELPHLLPSQKLAPAPAPRVGTVPLPKPVVASQTPSGNVPRIAGKAGTPTPKVKAVAAPSAARAAAPVAQRAVLVRSTGELKVEDEEVFHPLKWLCIGLAIIIVAALSVNYLFVDRPLVSNLGETPYAPVAVYAHLGAFMQPNVLVIHIPPSSTLKDDNLMDFLVALAHSTPSAPLSGNVFERVVITPGYTGRYSFSGYAWKQLGDMTKEDDAQRKESLLADMGNASGEPVMSGNSNLSDEAQRAARDKLWADFAAQFVKN